MQENLFVPETVYLATYVAIADNRLFDNEWFRIESILNDYKFDSIVRDNAIKIILDRPDKISLEQTIAFLNSRSVDVRMNSIRVGLEIAFEDKSFGDKENVLFQQLRTSLGIDRKKYDQLLNEVKKNALAPLPSQANETISIRSNSMKKRYANSLFSSDDYTKVIQQMATIAVEDISYASKKVGEVTQMYRVYPQMLKNQTEAIIKYQSHLNDVEEKKQLQDFFNELLASIDRSLENANENLNALQERQAAASETFTISFMGRTKAGKSTLHSVLLGGINNDFIGRGSERTTRYNYIYDFEGIRIIDTPGIGAPGGKSDEEIAQEVADESDLICYVVTSDSIQETEFNFLKKLKEQNKPVLILLNKKENFTRSEKKLKAFLDSPLDWYERKGEDAIQGHLDRINEYVTLNHDYHNFSIVPVHLLATKLAVKETDSETKRKLMEGSRIEVFLNMLSEMINDSGILQRSQTIYNSAVYHIGVDKQTALEQKNVVGALREEIARNSDKTLKAIKEFGDKKRNDFINSFNTTFNSFIKENVRKFANENIGISNKELNSKWSEFLASSRLEEKLNYSYEMNWNQYQTKVQDILKEAEEDLNFSMEFGTLSNVKIKKVVDVKFALEMIGSILTAVGVFIGFTPVGWALMGVGLVVGIVSAFVKSKDKKIDDAKGKLYDSLADNVNKMRERNLIELLKKYDSSRKKICEQITKYNEAIDLSLVKIYQILDELCIHLAEVEQDLNTAYGARIANFMIKNTLYDINDAGFMKQLNVDREFKKYIKLTDPKLYIQPRHISEQKMEQILQEKLIICEETK